MTVPIQISWDLFAGKALVWSDCLLAGVRRAVLLPRLDPIFTPLDEDPAREHAYTDLDWRLISPTEHDWEHYRELVEKLMRNRGISFRSQRVENLARWVGGRQVVLPQYHFWLFREEAVRPVLDRLYDELDPAERRGLWKWLLAWTSPAEQTTF